MKALKIQIFLVAGLLVMSCSTQKSVVRDGYSVPRGDGLAYIKGTEALSSYGSKPFKTSIAGVDGKEVVNSQLTTLLPLLITPQQHHLNISTTFKKQIAVANLSFIAKPNRQYEVRQRPIWVSPDQISSVEYWIVESDSGEIVSQRITSTAS
jgi:hypothetical protein